MAKKTYLYLKLNGKWSRLIRPYTDNEGPSLVVNFPSGSSASSPTYYQADAATNYTVSGIVTDAGGVASVTVNGAAATINGDAWSCVLNFATNTTHTVTVVAKDMEGNATTVVKYLRVEGYYQQASRIAGTVLCDSLVATLSNTTAVNAFLNSAEARNLLKSKYTNEMNSLITTNFNADFNYLNYTMALKAYVIYNNTVQTKITDLASNSYSGESFRSSNKKVSQRVNYKYFYAEGTGRTDYGSGPGIYCGFGRYPESNRASDYGQYFTECVLLKIGSPGDSTSNWSGTCTINSGYDVNNNTTNSDMLYATIGAYVGLVNGYGGRGAITVKNWYLYN